MFQLRLGAGGVILWTEVKGRVLNPADRNGRWCSGPSSAGTGFTTKSCSCCPAGATVALSGGRIVELDAARHGLLLAWRRVRLDDS